MKQFLVPALLLALVGTAAALAANSAPVVTATPSTCHALTAMSGMCPFSGGNHCDADAAKGAVECTEAATEECPMGDKADDCEKRCEEQQEMDCCKKKMDCSKCPKHEAPVEKP